MRECSKAQQGQFRRAHAWERMRMRGAGCRRGADGSPTTIDDA
jgi:hypothetical protein